MKNQSGYTPSILDRSQIPIPEELRPFRFPDFEQIKLSNGLLVIVAAQNHLPLVSVNLCLNASGLTDPVGTEGLSYLLTETLFEGTKEKTSTEIANALELLGTNYYTHADWNAIQIEINSLSKNLDASMMLYAEVLKHAVFPEREVERVKKELIIERQRVSDNPAKLSNEFLYKQMYNGHRYGIPLEGDLASIQKIKRDHLLKYYKSIFIPNESAIIFAGDISREKALKLAEDHFGDWRPGKLFSIPKFAGTYPKTLEISLIHKPGAAQAEMRLGHLGIERADSDYYAITLLNEIFGGYFLSRINMNLREKHGYTYGASSVFSYRKIRGPFLIAASVQNEAIDKAVQEVIYELERIQSEFVSDEELANAKGYLTGVFPVAFETVDQVAMGLANLVIFRLEQDFYQNYPSHINNVTQDEILRAAKKHLHPDKMHVVITGDRTKLEDRLKGLGRLSVFDLNGIELE
jgi:zinc protease